MDNKDLQIPENAVVLFGESLKDWTVDDMRMWISQNKDESDIANHDLQKNSFTLQN